MQKLHMYFWSLKIALCFWKMLTSKRCAKILDIDSLLSNDVSDFASFGPLLDCILFDFKTSSNDLVNHLNLKP